MVDVISHRGPDAQMTWVEGPVGLGHARLTILDLTEAGLQPMHSHSGKTVIVFNGEIYNFRALREELKKEKGIEFKSENDAEVLLELYEEIGTDMFPKLNGMWSLAIWDREKEQLVLSRDRMGQKPLFYGAFDGTLVFGSELKAVMSHPSVSKEIDLVSLNQYLTFEYVPTPRSMIKGVSKLEPGTYKVWSGGKFIKEEEWWSLSYGGDDISYEEATTELDNKLSNAVRDRLISDVPLGVFLSGGLDSSTIAYYGQKHSKSKIKTFSIGFEDPSYDETAYAQKVAEQLGTDHHHAYLTPDKTLELIPTVMGLQDEPFADASIIPTYFLSWHARQQVTVALGGDGSDELFAGYPTFISDRYIKMFSAMPGVIRSMFKWGAGILPVSDANISFDFKVRQFLQGFEMQKQQVHSLWLGSFGPKQKRSLLSETASRELNGHTGLEPATNRYKQSGVDDWFHQTIYAYCKTYLLDDILAKVDRASMYNSLEVRAPFLDYRLVNFVNSLPREFKYKGDGKRILKAAMRGKIPDEVIDRPKKGFGIPLSKWLRSELKPIQNELFSSGALAAHGLFDQEYVEGLVSRHDRRKVNNRKLLWTLMVFQFWYQNYIR